MNFLAKLLKFFMLFVVPVFVIAVLVISYFALKKLAFPYDRIMPNGKKQSVIAVQANKDILKRPNCRFVNFNSKDGIKLSGCLLKSQSRVPKGNLLLCHGYASRKEFMYDFIDMFPDYNIFLFDFRAHGNSQGRIRTIGFHEYKDVLAATEYFKKQMGVSTNSLNQTPFVILGVSMGGAATLKAVEAEPNLCDILIIDSAFANLKRVIRNAFCLKSGLPAYPFLSVLKTFIKFAADCNVDEMNLLEKLDSVKQPVLYIHSCVDEIVPPDETLSMYANTGNKKSKLWIGPACRHGQLRKLCWNTYKNKVFKFFKAYCGS